MAKYSAKAQEKVRKTLHEEKEGTLKSGSGKKVTSRKQALAIGLSEARKAGAKVPPEKKASEKSASGRTKTKKTDTKKKATRKKTSKKKSKSHQSGRSAR